MKTQVAKVGARGTDSVQSVDSSHAKGLKTAGIDFVVRYLGSVTPVELKGILDAGLAFMAVTYADRFDGAAAVIQLHNLGLPQGCTVWLDIEGQSIWTMDPLLLISKINAWADAVKAAGFMPGLYIGSPQPLTSLELYALHVVRYWRAPSRVMDRHGAPAEPSCAYCMSQLWPSVMWAGVWTDVNFIGQDYQSRVPSWVVQ